MLKHLSTLLLATTTTTIIYCGRSNHESPAPKNTKTQYIALRESTPYKMSFQLIDNYGRNATDHSIMLIDHSIATLQIKKINFKGIISLPLGTFKKNHLYSLHILGPNQNLIYTFDFSPIEGKQPLFSYNGGQGTHLGLVVINHNSNDTKIATHTTLTGGFDNELTKIARITPTHEAINAIYMHPEPQAQRMETIKIKVCGHIQAVTAIPHSAWVKGALIYSTNTPWQNTNFRLNKTDNKCYTTTIISPRKLTYNDFIVLSITTQKKEQLILALQLTATTSQQIEDEHS